MKYVSVLLDDSLDKPLDYAIPEDLENLVEVGSRVTVLVRNSKRSATIIEVKQSSEVPNPLKLLSITSETPVISPELFKLASWISKYYCTPFRRVLKSILPSAVRDNVKRKSQLLLDIIPSKLEIIELCEKLRNKAPAQATILDIFLKEQRKILLSELLEKSKASRSSVNTLIKNKILVAQDFTPEDSPWDETQYFKTGSKKLNEEQEIALNKIKQSIDSKAFNTHLVFGVTGSGKTEVYLQAIEYCLNQGKGVLFLVPEISLAPQTVEKLVGRFCQKVFVLHHRMSSGERHESWKKILKHPNPIVLGARSSIFAPINNLGLIIIDEEHELSYKQSDEMPCYNARDVAVMRAKMNNCTAVLGSATPSFESYYNALSNKYILSTLNSRATSCTLPKVVVVNMHQEYDKRKRLTLFSDALCDAISKRYQKGEQSLLFLNRRGFFSLRICKNCDFIFKCPNCDVNLTFHLNQNLLVCHHCDYTLTPPRECPKCKSSDHIKYQGMGTEKVEKELKAIFPDIRTLRLDADTTRHKGSQERLLKQFRSGKADVLIGTQMIGKGLHFPSITLVGILNADQGLHIPDFRASEHVFQLLTQVAGRAGRDEAEGLVIIQTSLLDNVAIRHSKEQNYLSFYEEEIESRKLFNYPPFTRIAKFIFSGENEGDVNTYANTFRENLLKICPSSAEVYPIQTCALSRIQKRFRVQFFLKSSNLSFLQGISSPYSKKISLLIDIDPLNI